MVYENPSGSVMRTVAVVRLAGGLVQAVVTRPGLAEPPFAVGGDADLRPGQVMGARGGGSVCGGERHRADQDSSGDTYEKDAEV